jgi:hypothetical protein
LGEKMKNNTHQRKFGGVLIIDQRINSKIGFQAIKNGDWAILV